MLDVLFSCVQSWAPRLQKAFSSCDNGSEHQVGWSLESRTAPGVNEDINNVVQSPEQTKLDLLVSPSPLVSWRTDCTTKGGRHLFLLKPIPRPKTFHPKFVAYLV